MELTSIGNQKSKIGNLPNGWPTPAAPLLKEATPTKFKSKPDCWIRTIRPTGVAGHVFKFVLLKLVPLVPPLRHFDPFGTELL
jgi:hypothetical protein